MKQTLSVDDTDNLDKRELQEGYAELKKQIAKNKEIINIIDGLLDSLNKNENFPFILFEMENNILPNLIGTKSTKFLTYILENGSNDFNLTDKIDLALYSLVKKHGITYVCASKFISNQLDFVTTQFIGTSEQNRFMIRFLRSDKKSMVFNLDKKTIIFLISRLIDNLLNGIKVTNEDLSKDEIDYLMNSIIRLLLESDYSQEYLEQVDDDDQ